MSEKKIWRVAVIGCGSFACGQYLPNIAKEANAVCVAVADIIYERATAAAERFGIPNAYHDVYELIERCAIFENDRDLVSRVRERLAELKKKPSYYRWSNERKKQEAK